MFSPSDVPASTFNSGKDVELGMIFQSDIAGDITELKYYRHTGDTVSHNGHLWDASGSLLATGVFPATSSVGWQTVTLTFPVAITANTNYTASYETNVEWAYTSSYWNVQINNGHLHVPASGGRYTLTGGTFPTGSTQNNYFVDVGLLSSDNLVQHICMRASANPYYGLIGLVTSANGALVSTATPGDTIPSVTTTLTAGTTGYGICVAAPSGADAGSATWAGDSPYASGSCDSTHHSVGQVQTTAQQFMHANGPVQNLYITGYVKAAIAGTVPPHIDYADSLTFVVSGTF